MAALPPERRAPSAGGATKTHTRTGRWGASCGTFAPMPSRIVATRTKNQFAILLNSDVRQRQVCLCHPGPRPRSMSTQTLNATAARRSADRSADRSPGQTSSGPVHALLLVLGLAGVERLLCRVSDLVRVCDGLPVGSSLFECGSRCVVSVLGCLLRVCQRLFAV